jgi:hypothetical protein
LRTLGKGLIAVLLASLLGVAVYYTSFNGENELLKPAYAFIWSQGDQQQAFEDYVNATLLCQYIGMYFSLKNGTAISMDNPSEYHGSIDSMITSVKVQLNNAWFLAGRIGVVSGVNITTGGPGWDDYPMANLTLFLNKTITSALVTSITTDMGSYTFHDGPNIREATSTPGYWPDASRHVTDSPAWTISSTQLLGFLEGSGSATIKFDAIFNAHMDFTISFPDNTTESGSKDLNWTGTIGTIGFTYDETGILATTYDFEQVQLVLLTSESKK